MSEFCSRANCVKQAKKFIVDGYSKTIPNSVPLCNHHFRSVFEDADSSYKEISEDEYLASLVVDS